MSSKSASEEIHLQEQSIDRSYVTITFQQNVVFLENAEMYDGINPDDPDVEPFDIGKVKAGQWIISGQNSTHNGSKIIDISNWLRYWIPQFESELNNSLIPDLPVMELKIVIGHPHIYLSASNTPSIMHEFPHGPVVVSHGEKSHIFLTPTVTFKGKRLHRRIFDPASEQLFPSGFRIYDDIKISISSTLSDGTAVDTRFYWLCMAPGFIGSVSIVGE